MSAWLITGGAGFIGANFTARALKHTTARLIVLDALTYAGDLARLDGLLGPRCVFVKGDVRDEVLVHKLFAAHAISHVIHFAAESHVDRSILGPREFIQTNIEGTMVLLEAARSAWHGDCGGKRFLLVSTDEVFGSLGPQDPPFNEETPYRPNSPYSSSKAAADHLARAWHHTYGLPVVISNCSNNYGPWQFPEKLLPLMILNAVEGRPLPVYGDGLQVRDWLHVEDHVSALLLILEHGLLGRTYCIGGHDECPNLEVVFGLCDTVDAVLGQPQGTSRKLIQHVADRPGHDRRYAIDSARIRQELGWIPTQRLSCALPELVRWYVGHKPWCDAVRSGAYRAFYEQQYGPSGTP